MSSQCPLQTDASSSHAAEIVKITGFDMSAPSGWDRRYAGDCEIQASVARMERREGRHRRPAAVPDYAPLHPGYALHPRLLRLAACLCGGLEQDVPHSP